MIEKRNLSGIYFREKRGEKWDNVCFEDLTEESQDRILADKNPEFVKNLAKMLAHSLRKIGDKFDILKK